MEKISCKYCEGSGTVFAYRRDKIGYQVPTVFKCNCPQGSKFANFKWATWDSLFAQGMYMGPQEYEKKLEENLGGKWTKIVN